MQLKALRTKTETHKKELFPGSLACRPASQSQPIPLNFSIHINVHPIGSVSLENPD